MKQIIDMFPIGQVKHCTPLSGGLVHGTWGVDTEYGRYILQKLHPSLADEDRLVDFVSVTQHLAKKDVPAPTHIPTKEGALAAYDADGMCWRLQTRLPGESRDHFIDQTELSGAGNILGRFHEAIQDIPSLKAKAILHDTPRIYAQLLEVFADIRKDLYPAEFLEDVEYIQTHLPQLFLPQDVPQTVIHGDPKSSNFLFFQKKAFALIDLDTCQMGSVLLDLGDAFRSWCGQKEDAQDNQFSIKRFASAWQGYCLSGHCLSQDEKHLIAQSVLCITLELAARFAIDVVEDRYFGWDASFYTSRTAHNMARTAGQVRLAKDIERQKREIQELVSL